MYEYLVEAHKSLSAKVLGHVFAVGQIIQIIPHDLSLWYSLYLYNPTFIHVGLVLSRTQDKITMFSFMNMNVMKFSTPSELVSVNNVLRCTCLSCKSVLPIP